MNMRKIGKKYILKPLALYLAFCFFLIGSMPRDSWAYFVESQQALNLSRDSDNIIIQRVLESKIVKQRLSELGLSFDDINSRINYLSDADIHQFATNLDSLMPGGFPDPFISIIALLLIAILVLVIIQMTGHKVIIK